MPPDDCFLRLYSVFSQNLFLFVLDKSVLLHSRCLMSNFFGILILVYRKIFPVFYVILLETFSNSYGLILSILIYYFMINIFVQSWLIWATFHFVSSKVPFVKLWSEECSFKTASKNAEAAIRKCSSK